MLSKHYNMIKTFYGDKITNRTGVLYMNHIDEGLLILDHLGASDATKSAFCIHPIFQIPTSLKDAIDSKLYDDVDPYVLLLTMEYRNKANAFVCRIHTDNFKLTDLPHMVLPEVAQMLVADKIQNYKDFIKFHKYTHDRSTQLTRYFELWLIHLNVRNEDELLSLIE